MFYNINKDLHQNPPKIFSTSAHVLNFSVWLITIGVIIVIRYDNTLQCKVFFFFATQWIWIWTNVEQFLFIVMPTHDIVLRVMKHLLQVSLSKIKQNY
jgi:hypothetical protein